MILTLYIDLVLWPVAITSLFCTYVVYIDVTWDFPLYLYVFIYSIYRFHFFISSSINTLRPDSDPMKDPR